ncbi:hypothetical protein FIBSPDRAFT_924333 [Athelia psychrophila]|uniref:Uncharacterized protein n=1 Tax=Athelia psychrophila TaxID=1759441 RepID=A0A166WQ89_9AGAM|nr:hypothetical protein FIBSPDRAFT_924333 [Fibularhizoctonia sp. CBS 109695]
MQARGRRDQDQWCPWGKERCKGKKMKQNRKEKDRETERMKKTKGKERTRWRSLPSTRERKAPKGAPTEAGINARNDRISKRIRTGRLEMRENEAKQKGKGQRKREKGRKGSEGKELGGAPSLSLGKAGSEGSTNRGWHEYTEWQTVSKRMRFRRLAYTHHAGQRRRDQHQLSVAQGEMERKQKRKETERQKKRKDDRGKLKSNDERE